VIPRIRSSACTTSLLLLLLLAGGAGCMHDLEAFPVVDAARPDLLTPADQRPPEPDQPTDLGVDITPDLGHDLPTPCPVGPDANTLLFFGFEGSGSTVVDSSASKRNGTLRGTAQRAPGMATCGQALSLLPFSSPSYVRVPNSNVWELDTGSIDLSLKFSSPSSGTMGILSRDAKGTTKAGHLTLVKRSGYLALRLERQDSKSAARCLANVPIGRWLRIGINFGGSQGLQLWVDGQLANSKGKLSWGTELITCGTGTTSGIKGNDNPWIVGAHSRDAPEGHSGSTSHVADTLFGSIDNLRISRVRRDYAQEWLSWKDLPTN
jgi:hypothetical protein